MERKIILLLGAMIALAVFSIAATTVSALAEGATVARVSGTENPTPSASGSDTTKGGNITVVNITVDSYTERWAGYYGNVTGNVSLSDGSNDLYSWAVGTPTGEVIATVGTPTWTSLAVTTRAEVDTAWSFSSGSDQAADTYTDASVTVNIGDSGNLVTTGVTLGNFQSAAIEDTGTPTQSDILFVGIISNDATAFDGTTADYQMVVATDVSGSETYYFYAELA